MQTIRSLAKPLRCVRPVVAIGIFDGVHVGHRFILRQAVRQARAIRGTSVVLTFWPHPRNQESIYSLAHRLRIFAQLGIDICVALPFTRRLKDSSPDGFVRGVIAAGIRAHTVVVGENFRFGRDMQGTPAVLASLGARYGFAVRVISLRQCRGRTVSSSIIRRLITRGRLADAARLLGRPVSILGSVVRGRGIGKTWGIATANIAPEHEVLPPHGVYAVWVLTAGKRFPGACYIGRAPSFVVSAARGAGRVSVEVHIFGLARSLYGRQLEVQFIKKIRSPRHYSCAAPLVRQIRADIAFIKRTFPHHKPTTISSI